MNVNVPTTRNASRVFRRLCHISGRRGVFISYRRDTGSHTARSIKLALEQRGLDVFLDVDGLGSALFKPTLLHEIASRKDFVVVLGPHSLDRCVHDGDWLRLEICHALMTGRNIVPIFDDGFDLDKEQLPADMEALREWNGVHHTEKFFIYFMDQLCRQFLVSRVHIRLQSIAPFAAVLVFAALLVFALFPTSELVKMESHRQQAVKALGEVEWQDALPPILTQWEQDAHKLSDTSLRQKILADIADMRGYTGELKRPVIRNTLQRIANDISAANDLRRNTP